MDDTLTLPLADTIIKNLELLASRKSPVDRRAALRRLLQDGVVATASPTLTMAPPRAILEPYALELALAAAQGNDAPARPIPSLSPRIGPEEVGFAVQSALASEGASLPEDVSSDDIWWWQPKGSDFEYAVDGERVVGMIALDPRVGWESVMTGDFSTAKRHGNDKVTARAHVEALAAERRTPPPAPAL